MRYLLRILFTVLSVSVSIPAQPDTAIDTPGCEFSDAVRHTRPDAGRQTTEVRIATYLVDLPRIDDVEQSYIADVFLRYRWQDQRLVNGRTTTCVVPLTAIWNPGVLVVNQRTVTRQMLDVAEVQPDGTVSYLQRFYGTFTLPLDLTRFPFDRQKLPITLVVRHTPDEVKLVPDSEMIAVADHLSNPNWSIGTPEVATGEYKVYPGRSIAQLQFMFPAKRRSGYYLWKLAVPMSFVVFMSWAVFWVGPQNIGPRVALAATSMLTLIAFRLALSSSLPPIPYLTVFDMFTIGSTVLVFTALLQAVFTSSLWEKEQQALALRVNRVSQVLFPLAFAVVTALSLGRLALSA